MQLPRFGPSVTLKNIPQYLARAQKAAEQLEARKHELVPTISSEKLKELIDIYEEASVALTLADAYADIVFSINSADNEARNTQTQVSRVSSDLSSKLLFFSLTMKSWPTERLEYYSKHLPQYKAWFSRLAKFAPYTLSENEERIIVYKDTSGEELLKKLYQMITSEYTYTITVDGETKTVTRAELSVYFNHAKREVRKAATEALIVPFTKDHAVLSELYQGLVEDFNNEQVKLRNHPNAIHGRHLGNGIPEEAFEALRKTIKKNKHVFHEYIKLKQKALGYSDFTRYDFSAPVHGLPEHVTYEHSKERVLDVFGHFSPWMKQHAQRIFDEGRIDVPPAKGKRGGACCYGMVPGEAPVVILNFAGQYDDMFTMAHELGHAIHDVLSGAQNNDLTYHPPLVLAETASTFAEALLFAAEVRDALPDVKKALLCQRLDDILGSSISQMRITEFELQAYEHLSNGGSVEELNTLWSALQKEDFPFIEYPEHSVYWSAIPHIYNSPFYCYSYAFGILLVLALYKRYEEEGQAFVTKMEKLLAAGGSKEPVELLGELGYDITSTDFWQGGIDVVSGFVRDLSELVK